MTTLDSLCPVLTGAGHVCSNECEAGNPPIHASLVHAATPASREMVSLWNWINDLLGEDACAVSALALGPSPVVAGTHAWLVRWFRQREVIVTWVRE